MAKDTTSNTPQSQDSFEKLMQSVQLAKPMAEATADAMVGSYRAPGSPLIGNVSTPTVGSVPIFGSSAALIPVENIDKMYLVNQQQKQKQQALDAAIMGEAMPYYELATSNASKAFNSITSSYLQSRLTTLASQFGNDPQAYTKARKALATDLGSQVTMNNFSAFQKQYNSVYADLIAFMGANPSDKNAKANDWMPPTMRKRLNGFLAAPEMLFENAIKSGSYDLTEAGSMLDQVRTIMRPFKDVQSTVKAYVDGLGKTVTETMSKSPVHSTNKSDMYEVIRKEFYKANPDEYATQIFNANYADLDENSEMGMEVKQLISNMVKDGLSSAVTKTYQTISNDRLGSMQFAYQQQQDKKYIMAPMQMGYTVKDAEGRAHARRLEIPDFVPTAKPSTTTVALSGAQVLYDPSSNKYIMPIGGAETTAYVSGVGTFKKQFTPKEGNWALTTFGSGAAWNGVSNQVNGHVATVFLGTPKDEQQRMSETETVRSKTKSTSATTTTTAPKVMKVRIFDPSTGQVTVDSKYNVENKMFLLNSRSVIGNVAAADENVGRWYRTTGGVPDTEQIRTDNRLE